MPIFEYTCNACQKEFERLVFKGDDSNVACPACKSNEVTKKMSATSFMAGGLGGCASAPAQGFS